MNLHDPHLTHGMGEANALALQAMFAEVFAPLANLPEIPDSSQPVASVDADALARLNRFAMREDGE